MNSRTFNNPLPEIPPYTLQVSIAPSGVCVYKDFWAYRKKKQSEAEGDVIPTTENEKRNNADKPEQVTHERFMHNGMMSEFSRRKLKKSIEWLNFAASEKKAKYRYSNKTVKFKLSFATLTLPSEQKHTDQVIKSKCLNYLLTELRKFHGLRNYIWRAEKQENGNIHFHIVTDSFLDAQMLRKRWNRITNNLGYVDAYQEKMQANIKDFSDYVRIYGKTGSYIQLRKRYHAGKASNWSNPNSTDIHSTRKVKNMVAYLMKYMSKNVEHPERLTDDERRRLLVDGQLWGLSESLTHMRNITINENDREAYELAGIWDNPCYRSYHDEYFDFKVIPIGRFFMGDCPLMALLITQVIQEHLNPQFNQANIT